jgi:hypothetical protein
MPSEFEKALEEASYSTDIDFDFHGGARWAREWLDEQEHLKVSFEAITEIKKLRTENAKLRGALKEWLDFESDQVDRYGPYVSQTLPVLILKGIEALKETGGDE